MKEALLYEKLDNKCVRCLVCDYKCLIKDNNYGVCRVRKNVNGVLHSLNNGFTIAASIDPIEKKPLYHFLPKTKIYSFAALGCNMHCLWCQNYDISQVEPSKITSFGMEISPEEHVQQALKHKTPSIAYTYSEPTVFLEYALEVMKLAKKNNIKNVWVSNGFMSKETLNLILPYLDAINIDLKGPDNAFYQKYSGGLLTSVIRNLKEIKSHPHVHLEITTLLISDLNDSEKQIKQMIDLIISTVGKDVPWHISRFFPAYKLRHYPPTPIEKLYLAEALGKQAGMKHIYLGNI
jgi:pyruvate formate lyase activating enzyme